ncbi:TRAM domain-containing protein [Parafrigoribacterium mesophilum]|uniref:class I SAM-dependent RNA methyltransferase n=1 Tax=Parafrigoribacterium mesophilum TaxID=433646 RepID=UPI0031FBB16C
MGEWLGKHIEIEVTKIAHGGVAVGRHDGRVVFVADAIPGETVRAVITDDAKDSFWRADTVAVLTASPHRRPHVWSAAALERTPDDRAGGAEFGHIELSHQRELKRQVLAEALSRMAGVATDAVVEPAHPAGGTAAPDDDGTGWRTRVRLHVAEDGTVGPYAARSHRVIPVTDLPLASAGIARVSPLTERFPGAQFVDLLDPSTGDPQVLVNTGQRARRTVITEKVGERSFRLDARGFWQVHRDAAATLTAAVQEAIDPARFDPAAENLDLYGGVGLLAAAMADRAGGAVRLTTVESDRGASAHAAHNLAQWSARAVADRVDRYLRALSGSAGSAQRAALHAATVLLDPPRSGAGKAVVAELAALAPTQLVYVACDPVALARDLGLLRGHGYELTALRAFDLFPHTHHLEAVATLVRA